MELKTDALVLRSADYKDNDKILTLFSADMGKITAVARGVKKTARALNSRLNPLLSRNTYLRIREAETPSYPRVRTTVFIP